MLKILLVFAPAKLFATTSELSNHLMELVQRQGKVQLLVF